jgi:hypothetical protein
MEVLLVLIDAPCAFYPNLLERFKDQIWLWLYQYKEITFDWHRPRLNCYTKTHLREKWRKTIRVEGLKSTLLRCKCKNPRYNWSIHNKGVANRHGEWNHYKQHIIFWDNPKQNVDNWKKELNSNISEVSFLGETYFSIVQNSCYWI